MPQVHYDLETAVDFLDGSKADEALIKLLHEYDVLGIETDRLLRKYLPQVDGISRLTVGISRPYKLCRAIIGRAVDPAVLNQYLAVMLKADPNAARWVDEFAANRLRRTLTRAEAEAVLEKMIRHAPSGSRFIPGGGLIDLKSEWISLVTEFASNHSLDATAAKTAIVRRYRDLAGDIY